MIGDIKCEFNESIEKFRLFSEKSLIGTIIIQDGIFKYFDELIAEIFGCTLEEMKSWAPHK
ncbi:MAG: hypothetical protein ACFFCE_08165 [Promethearchaeota archaeon]